MDLQVYKDINGQRLTQDFINEFGDGIIDTPTYAVELNRYIKRRYEEDQPTLPVVEQQQVEVVALSQSSSENAIVITTGYQEILGVILQDRFFGVEVRELDEDLLFDLIERRVITSKQAKDLKYGRKEVVEPTPLDLF